MNKCNLQNNQKENLKRQPRKIPLTVMDVVFFVVLCMYVGLDPYKNGINMSNIAGFLPTGIVFLLMIAKNLKENEIITLENELDEKEEKIKKLEPLVEANIRKKAK